VNPDSPEGAHSGGRGAPRSRAGAGWLLMGIARRERWFQVLECMGDGEARTARELSAETGMPVSEVCRWLEFLDARGLITSPADSR
jgi:hypothetical protein